MTPPSVVDHAVHTPYSDPGEHAARLAEVSTDPAELGAVARNVIVHYRASGHELPAATRHEIDSRWMDRILAADQQRHPWPLAEPREVTDRVQGCCRDHTLFCVSVLRAHDIPARSRVGFAGYFTPGWHHDHVIVEAWLEGRWQSFDAEVDAPWPTLPTPLDMSLRDLDGTGFATAARVWAAYRDGDLDPDTYGVDPNVPDLRGRRFLFDEVIYEIAHRFGDELLLWDGWGRITGPGAEVTEEDAAWLDGVAALLLAADDGDLDAEAGALSRYRSDAGLHPGPTIVQASPFGDPPVDVTLARS